MAEAWLSLGGNTGDRKAAMDEAVARLGRLAGTAVTARCCVREVPQSQRSATADSQVAYCSRSGRSRP